MHRLSVIYPISIGLGCRSGHFANHSETCWALTFTAHAGDCTCLEASRSHFGHANEGAAQTHILWKRPKAVDLSSRFYADPCAIPDDLGATHPRPFLDTEERGENLERLKHVFNRLSPELKFEIFSYQSFDELLNIRLVCRDLAPLATVNTLPQSYWRSRLLLVQEADFLFPKLTDTRDWSWLFFWIRASLTAGLLLLLD